MRKPTPELMDPVVGGELDIDAVSVVFGSTALTGVQAIPIEMIDDNPFQPRENYAGIEELAADIAANGLLQIPKGRRIDTGHVQLQYGHRRLRAVRHLGWTTMPVEVQLHVADDDMAVRAWAENHNRQDFSPIDRARYFNRLLTTGWTQKQIAERLQISASVVSSALRLLELPQDLQQQVAEQGLSARQAEAIAALKALPEMVIAAGENQYYDTIKPSAIIRDALSGASSDTIRERTIELIRRTTYGTVHDQPWYAMEIGGDGILSLTCKACSHTVRRDAGVFCAGERLCMSRRADAWARDELADAADLMNLPALGMMPLNYSQRTVLTNESGLWEKVQAESCPHDMAGVVYDTDIRWKTGPLKEHPHAVPVCAHGTRKCRCLLELQRAAKADRPDANKTGTAVRRKMKDAAVPPLADMLATVPPVVLRYILSERIRYSLGAKHNAAWTHEQIAFGCAERIIEELIWDGFSPSANRNRITTLFHELDLVDPFAASSARESAVDQERVSIEAALAQVKAFLADVEDFNDGIPTADSVAARFRRMDELGRQIAATVEQKDVLRAEHSELYDRLAALSDRVQASSDKNELSHGTAWTTDGNEDGR